MYLRNVAVLLAVAVLISLGTIQYADASIFNERASSPSSKTEVDGTIYHNSSPVEVRFNFDGYGGNISAAGRADISITGGTVGFAGFSDRFLNGTSSFYHIYSIFPVNAHNIVVTVTYPANSFAINGISNDAVTYTFVSDRTSPTFEAGADFSTVELTVGDDSPTLPTLQCRDTNISTTSAPPSGSVNANLAGDYPVEYTCRDKAGNSVTETKTYRVLAASTVPVVPANISIASDNARDTSLAKIDDTVTITFDTEAGSTAKGTIGGGTATFTFNGTSSILTRTLNGTESSGVLAFSFVQSNSNGDAATQTAVIGAGIGLSVTADFVAPVFATSTDATAVTLGDTVPTLSTLCTDANIPTVTNDAGSSATFDAEGDKTILYTCTDAAGNTATQSVSYSVAAPDTTKPVYSGPHSFNIIQNSHFGNFNARTSGVECTDDTDGSITAVPVQGGFPTNIIKRYIVSYSCTDDAGNRIVFATQYFVIAQPIVSMTIGSVPSSTGSDSIDVSITFGEDVTGFETGDIRVTNSAGHALSGTGSSYTLTITPTQDGTITVTIPRGAVQAGSAINAVASFSFVSDRAAPAIPTYISIASDNADSTKAKLGNIVTITFDTEEGSTVEGTIGGGTATFAFNGTSSTLTRTLNGTESSGVLAFSFVQSNSNGDAATQTVVKGAGSTTSVTADFAAPIITSTVGTFKTVNQNVSYTLPDMTCEDAVDGNSTINPPVTLHTDRVGVNTIYYQCSDAAGNESARFAYIVSVTQVTPPVPTTTILRAENGANATQSISLELTGKHPIYLDQGQTYTAPTLSCIDNTTGSDVKSNPTLLPGSDTVTSATLGDYTQHYSCTGTQGTNNYDVVVNVFHTAKIHEIRSGDDVLFLNTTAPKSVSYSTAPLTMTFHGYATNGSVISLYDDTTSQTHPAMTSIVLALDKGNIEYTFTPTSGANPRISIHADGFSNVDDDYGLAQDGSISSPTLTLNGDAVMSLEKDAAFTDPGASCSDPEDGTLTVSTAGSVDNTAVGLHNLSYTCTDSDGHVDTGYRSVYITDTAAPADTTAPAAPIFTTSPATVRTTPVTLAGTAEVGSTVELFKGETSVATATATSGTFEFAGVALDEGVNYFTVTATDASSNTSVKSGVLVIILDTAALPPAPTLDPIPRYTNATSYTFTGTGIDGNTIYVYTVGDGPTNAPNAVSGGTWSITFPLSEGTYITYVRQAADPTTRQLSPPSLRQTMTVDHAPPAFATSTATTDVTFGDTVPTLSTLCTDANTITVTNDAGSATFDAEGAKTVLYTCTDAAGNTATQSVSYSVAAASPSDTLAPAAPIFTNSTAIVGTTPVTLAGTAEADSTVELFKGGTSVTTVTATSGNFEFTGVELAEGSNDFTIAATDASSNVSAKSDALVITLDTTDPVFDTSTDATDVTFGDTVPTLSALCTDANIPTVTNDAGSATFDAVGAKTVIYTCTDAAGNTATQSVSYSVAATPSTFNESALSITSKTEVDGTIYHRASQVLVRFDFDGDGTSVDQPSSSDIVATNGVMDSDSNHGTNGTSFFNHRYSVNPSSDGTVTVTYPANSFTVNGASNDAVTYTFVSDRTSPTFETGADFSTVELTVGGDSPTLPTLQCRDAYISTTSAPPSGSVNANLAGDYPVEYTCRDKAGNFVTETKTYRVLAASTVPVVPANISIASDNARDTSLAKIGDTVTITFDTEEGSTVAGTIGGKDATFTFNGTSSTLTRTLNGTETEDLLAFSFVQTDATDNDAAPQTAVKGAGVGSSVTADFTPPDPPASIYMTYGGDVTNAKLGDTVIVVSNVESGSTVRGTIDGKYAAPSVVNTLGTLTRTLDGTETENTQLTFSFVQTDAAGNDGTVQTAFIGAFKFTVILDFTAPAIPVFTNSTATVSSSSVTLAGDADDGSTVTLYKGESVVTTVTATGGTFEFARVALTEGSNDFTIAATDASSNVSAKSDALVITLDTADPVFATSTDTTDVTFGDTIPTLSALCTDANIPTVTNDAGSATFDAEGAKTVLYTCTDAAGNTATQSVSYSVAAPPNFNERASSPTSKTEVDGTIYHNLSQVQVRFDFDGDGTSVDQPSSSDIVATNGVMNTGIGDGIDGTSSFYHVYFVRPSSDGTVTVTYPANSFTVNGASNVAVTYTFVSDRTSPTFETGADFSTVELAVGGDSPTLPTLQCRDAYISTTSAPPSGSVNANLAGDYPVEYTCADNAGNTVTKTKTYRVLADSTAPAMPVFTTSPATVRTTPVILAGTAEADSVVTLYKGETSVDTVTATGGNFEFTGVALTEESNSFTVTATDASSNVSAKSGALVITLDTTAPAAPIFTNSTIIVSTSPVTLAGTAEADSTVELFKGETSVTTVTATTGGVFEFTGVALTEESNSFTITATDASSNTSAKSDALVITLDTAAPIITVTPLVITLELNSASPTLLDGVSTDDGSTVTTTGTVDVSTVDDYTIRYDSTDGTNAATTVTRTYHVTDTTAPIITVDPLEVTLELNSASPTLLDGVSTDDGSTVTTTGTVDVSTVDDYTIRYDSTDGTNAATTVTRTYHVTDTTAPIITVDPLEVTLELDSASPTLLDGVSTDDGSTVTTTGTVDVSTVDDYTIRYDSTDGTNAATTVTKTYHVTDTKAPIITVDPLEVTLELDSASPTLLDGVSTDDGSTVTTTGTVDVSTVDDYTIRYDSTDGTNAATTVTRTYHVTDTKAPIITVDPLEVTLELDSASPTLLDGVSTDDGSTVTTTGTVDVSTVDDYTIRYDSTDGTNAATTVTRTYHVTDTKAPIITVDPLEVTLKLNSASPTLLDGVSTDDGSTVTTTGTVDVSTVDDYTIRYDSTDGTNAATTATRTYHVTDTTAPIITVTPLVITLELDSASPTLLDGVSTDDGSTVTTTGTVDVSTVDDYTIRYDSTDGTNAATTATRTYHVTDTKAPAMPVFTNSTATVNSSPVILAGTAEADSTVELFKGVTSVATVTATGGAFEFAGVELAEGSNDFTIAATDASSNVSAKSGALVITLDTAAPPPAPTLDPIPRYTNATSYTFTGTGIDGNTIQFHTVDGDSFEVSDAVSGGTWSQTLALQEGTLTYFVRQSDSNGQFSPSSPRQTMTVDFTSDTAAPPVPTNIYITHDGDYPNARLGDTVTVTFDTEAGTAVEGTIDDETAKFTSDDYNGFLELTLDGDETQGSPLAFSFVQSNTHGTTVAQTEVKGFGDGTSVTADFIPPAIPTHISISHNGTSPNAKLGDVVTVTFDTEEGSAVTGTIDGKFAVFAFNGTSSTLTRTLNGTETQGVSLTFEFTQTDATGHVAAPQNAVRGSGAGTSVTIDPTPPAVPTDISITSDNARDPTLAKKGDVVTVTFDTEKGSAVTGTIDGKSAEDDVTGIAGTLTRTLDGTETKGLLAFSFVQTNDNGSNLAQTAVRGLGINSTVTADFTAPDVPTDISISRDGFLTNLELGETVTVTFDTEEGSTVEGTIDGKYATPDVTGTVGTLKLIIDGTETEGAPLTFEFIQTDAAGNVGTQQTAVKGTGSETSVFIERAVPVIPTNISISHDGDYTNARLDDTVTVTFDTEVGTTVEGTIGGQHATPDVTGTVGTLTRTLDGTVSERSPLTFEFTQFGRTNNVGIEQTAVKGSGDGTSVTADFTAPAVPTHISIFHDASNRAKSGDIVTITFDTEADSAVTGTIGGENATFAFNGTSSTLTRTLDGSETEGLLDFSFVQTDATGNSATTQTEVRGTGRGTYVISDFTAPPVPTDISIISSGTSFAYAKLDDTVTVTFDTEEDSAVEGTIGGKNATFAFDGSYSTLTRTLNGTEPEGILSFSFVQTDVIGNSAAAQTEVRGDSGETPSVTADFTAPDVSTHISIASDNARDPTKATLDDTVTITFDTEEDSNVVDGMIDGQFSFFALNGTIGTLELFIDGTVTEDEPLTFEFAITDAAGNDGTVQSAVKGSGTGSSVTADFVAPDVPTYISIAHDGVGTNAKSGDIVTVTFDTEEGSFVTGTIDGEYATPDVTGTVGTLKLTLRGYETQGSPLTFEFTQIDATGNAAEPQNAVIGTGSETSVTIDPTAPAVPANISITSDNDDPTLAKSGDIVTVTFDTVKGSTVKGTIDGKNAAFDPSGAVGTLKLTLSGDETEDVPLKFSFIQTNNDGSAAAQTAVKGSGFGTSVTADFVAPVIPIDISIAHDGASTNAKSGDIVTITFDTEADSTVEGTIGGENAKFAFNGASSTLTRTLDGSETPDVLTFSFVQTDAAGNDALAQDAVKGEGRTTSVTADFIAPDVPTHISISHDGASTNAKSGDIVTITFDTEADSTVEGTIGGENATFAFDGASSTLTRTLNGTETPGVLAFSFVQTDAAGNDALAQDAVKGEGRTTSVTADFVAPAIPTNISITSDNADPTKAKKGDTVTITFDTEEDSIIIEDTIDGEFTTPTLNGTSSTLKLTLSGDEFQGRALAFKFTLTDAAGNDATPQTAVKGSGLGTSVTADFIAPDVPDHISIASDNADDASKAKKGDIVTITFDTEFGSTVTGTIDGKDAKFTYGGPSSTLTRTLDGTETQGAPLAFNFNQTDATGNPAETQTAVKGNGDGTSITIDPPVPDVPTNISIESDNARDTSLAKKGDTVTVTFDTEEGSFVEGTIGGIFADDDDDVVTGTVGTLTITLDGSETEGLLAFSFVQTNDNGSAVPQTEVKGTGNATSVTVDFTAPDVPTDISIESDNARDPSLAKKGDTVTITFDTEVGSAVTGTIGGENATFTFNGTSSTLSRTLDGSETPDVLTFSFVQTDAAGNDAIPQTAVNGTGGDSSVTTDFTAVPDVPTNISIESDNARDTTLAKLGDIVTITFDTEEGSTVKGTIGGENATFTFNGASSTLTRTLDGSETPGVLTFSFIQTNDNGSAVPQTEVKGAGDGTSVTADFAAPAVPINISIASNNARDTSLAKLGDTVTITFDTEAGSTVAGTIGGENATFTFNGTSSTLARTLDGTETEDAPLTFKFTQTDAAAGNDATAQTAVKGTGNATSVTVDFVVPAFDSTIYISADVLVGNAIPTLTCNDIHSTTVTNDAGSATFDAVGLKTVTYTCTDAAGNTADRVIAYSVASLAAIDTTLTEAFGHTFLSNAPFLDFTTTPPTKIDTNVLTPGTFATALHSSNSSSFQFKIISGSFTPYSNPVLFATQDGNDAVSFTSPVKRGDAFIFTIPDSDFDLTKELKFRAEYVLGGSSSGKYYAETVFTQLPALVVDNFVSASPTTLVGTALAASTVTLFNNGTSVGTVTADGSGTFEFAGVALAEGSNSFTVTASNVDGYVSDPVNILLDAGLPAIPANISIESNNARDTSLAKKGDIVTITFDTEVGSAVKGTIGGKNATFTFNGTSSTLTRTLDGSETSGVLTFSFVQTDAVGNAASTQTAVRGSGSETSVTADFAAPAAPIFTTLPGTVSTTHITLAGTAEADSTVTFYKDGNLVDYTTATSGTFEFTGVVLDEGRNGFTLTATDAALNTSAKSGALVITLDTAAPADTTAPAIPVFTNSTTTVDSSPVILAGTAEADSTVELFNNGTSVTTVTATSGNFEFAGVVLDEGRNGFTIAATDASSNTSAKSGALVITLDTAAPAIPTIPTITSPTSGTSSPSETITVEGTGGPGIKISVCLSDNSNCSDVVTIGADGRWTLETYYLFGGENTLKLVSIIDGDRRGSDIGSPTVTITYDRPAFTDLIVNNIKSPIDPNDDQILYHYITTPSNVVSLYGTSVPNLKLDLIHVTGYDPDPSALVRFTSFTVIDTFVSSSDGTWQSGDFTLNEGSNMFFLQGHDNLNHSSGIVAIVTYDPAADEITVGAAGFHKPELIPKDSVSPIKLIPEPQKKSSGGSNDWHKKPTFGISHLTYKQIVDDGFTFNGYSLTVTDNWHTDFVKTSSVIGESNTVKIKTYAADPLKWINLYLGVSRIGDASDAESEIHLVVSRNYTNPVDYDLDEINHYQKEGLVNENNTSASISKVKCQASDNDERCYEFTINFTVMAPLHEEVVAISAMDEKRRQHVTYINEGVEFTGTPLLDAHTALLMQKKTNQGQAEIIVLTQQDRRYNVWEDQHGYLWTLNEYGAWTQITAADFERHQDGASSVMTRQNSNFAGLIEQERQKALLVFDSGDLISELDDYFAYDYSNVTSDMSKLEKYAYELQLESERAQKYSSNSD